MLNEKELNAEEVNKVIETKDAEYIYNFAKNVKSNIFTPLCINKLCSIIT